MLVEYKKKANLWLIIGFVVWLAGNAVKGTAQGQPVQMFGYGLFLVGMGMFIYGCMNYVKAKGYNQYWGLLGLLNLIGLIVLAILPDKNKIK